MIFSKQINVAVPDSEVWSLWEDTESWQEWTPSIIRISKLSPGPLCKGSSVLIEQPDLPISRWKITDWQEGKRFTWSRGNFLLRIHADHILKPGIHHTQVTLAIRFAGLLAGAAIKKTGLLVQAYLEQEAAGLKQRLETGRWYD